MLERIPVATWFPTQEPAECSLCREVREALTPATRRLAGEIALGIVTGGHVGHLIESVVNCLGAALGPGRVTVLVPEPGGKWRVFVSSDRSDTHDLMVDAVRYPELLEVRRTGTPYIAPSVEAAPELEATRPLLAAAGITCLAAYPILAVPGSLDPVVLKLSLRHSPQSSQLLLATLTAHLLVHRLARFQPTRVAHQLGLPVPHNGGYDPATVLRLLPLPAMVVDGEDRVLHANARAVWLLRGRGPDAAEDPLSLRLRPERPWLSQASRWEAHLTGAKGDLAVLGWSTNVDTDRTLVLIEPHPEARRRSHERRIRRTLAEKLRELEGANLQLQESARLRGRFVSDAAHELKTPLAILRSYLETLEDDLAEGLSGEQREFLRAATHGAGRLQRLVEELLDLAALESGHLPLLLGSVSSREVVRAVADELRPLAATAGIALNNGVDADLPLRADRERLRQVLRNLVENGIKFTQPGGEVAVGLERRGDRGVIAVRDTGIGIPPEALPRIFDEFFRVPGPHLGEGAGLGLAIVRRLVQAMGGQVWAESGPGAGSRFFVELPLWTGEG